MNRLPVGRCFLALALAFLVRPAVGQDSDPPLPPGEVPEVTESAPGARATSSISTARIAPTGSIITPSASSTVATRGRSRSSCTSGPMTVGPVTTPGGDPFDNPAFPNDAFNGSNVEGILRDQPPSGDELETQIFQDGFFQPVDPVVSGFDLLVVHHQMSMTRVGCEDDWIACVTR